MNAFSQPNYLIFFCTNTLSMLGLWMLRLSLGWLAWQITQSTFWTSMIVLAIWAPAGILGPAIAVYAENWRMRHAALACYFSMSLICAIIWLVEMTIGHTLASLLALTLLFGIIVAVYHPIRLVMITMLVPKPYLTSAVGLNATAFNTCRIVGPALAGISLAGIGLSYTLLVAMLLYFPVQVGILLVTLIPRERHDTAAQSFWRSLKSGVDYALSHSTIRFGLGIVAINSFFVRGVMEIQPAIVGQVLGGSSDDLAIATTAGGIGALLASALFGVGFVSKEALHRTLMPFCLLGLVLCLLMFWVTEIYALSLAFAVMGFTVTAVGIGSQMVIQLSVEEDYRARVLTWWATLSFGGLSIGGLLFGLLGEAMAIQYAIALAAIFGLFIVWYWNNKYPL